MTTAIRSPQKQASAPAWFVRRRPFDRVLSIVVWAASTWLLFYICFPHRLPMFAAPYAAFAGYFTWLCYRLLAVPLWAIDTLKVLQRDSGPADLKRPTVASGPRLLVLVAAYKAQGSIGSVLQTLRYQTYARELFHVYVITQVSENRGKWSAFPDLAESVLAAVRGAPRQAGSAEAELRVMAALIRNAGLVANESSFRLAEFALAGVILGWSKRRLVRYLLPLLLAEFFRGHHEGTGAAETWEKLRSSGILSNARCPGPLDSLLTRCSHRASRVLSDFSRILDLPPGASIFSDADKHWQVAAALLHDRIDTALAAHSVEWLMRRDLARYLGTLQQPAAEVRSTLAADSDLAARLRCVYDRLERTCPQLMDEIIQQFGPGFHHLCRQGEGGGKPESLNAGYDYILRSEPHLINDDTTFVVIDADSLLHSSALLTIAREIQADPDRCAIRQIAPLSTSNYRGHSAFVKLICCLDTIGSMGKWAHSTRTAERPDLPAGSGLVIPANLLEFLREKRGVPWDSRTITEDARLVISDYGLLDGATRKTRFVPVWLLEAVPEGRGFWAILRQYWTQRMRWASGGPEEVFALLKAFRTDSVFVRTRPAGGYERVRPGWAGRMAARLRQLRLTILWIHDHLWWGPGYALAPLLWLAFAFFFITPPALNLIGLVILVGLPAWTIFGVFRRFSPFVPGGLNWQDLVLLYSSAILLAWCHTWPVVYTHLLYAAGRRRHFKTWTTTAKPRF